MIIFFDFAAAFVVVVVVFSVAPSSIQYIHYFLIYCMTFPSVTWQYHVPFFVYHLIVLNIIEG